MIRVQHGTCDVQLDTMTEARTADGSLAVDYLVEDLLHAVSQVLDALQETTLAREIERLAR